MQLINILGLFITCDLDRCNERSKSQFRSAVDL